MGNDRDDSRRLESIYDDPYQESMPEDEERVRFWWNEIKKITIPKNIKIFAGRFHQKDLYATTQKDTKGNVSESKKEKED